MKKLIYYLLNYFSHNLENKIINILKNKKNIIIFDVGCFKGVFSRKILTLIKSKKFKFYLFDINKNVKKYVNDLLIHKDFAFHEVALSKKNGTAIYNYNRFFESSGSSLSPLFKNDRSWVLSRKILLKLFFQKTEGYIKYRVKTNTLDYFVKKNKIKLIDVLKVDIDGSELDFLKGAKKTLKKNKVKVVLIEINDKKINFRNKTKKIINFFSEMNYVLIKRHMNHSLGILSNAKSGDFLFVNKVTKT